MHTSSRNSQCTVGVNGNWSTRNLEMHFFNIEVRLETYRISKYSVTTSRGRIADYASRRFLSASSKTGLLDYSLFVLKSWFGANRNRRIVSHHGSSSQTLSWRTAKYASRRFQSASRKTGLTNYTGCILKNGLVATEICGLQLVLGLARRIFPGSAGMRFKLSNG
jgi:hypothetical protein